MTDTPREMAERLPTADKLDKLEALLRQRGDFTLKAIGHLMEPRELPIETLSADIIARLRASLSAAEKMAEALKWALPLAEDRMELYRIQRVQAKHVGELFNFTKKNGEQWVGLYQEEWDDLEKARTALADFESSRERKPG